MTSYITPADLLQRSPSLTTRVTGRVLRVFAKGQVASTEPESHDSGDHDNAIQLVRRVFELQRSPSLTTRVTAAVAG